MTGRRVLTIIVFCALLTLVPFASNETPLITPGVNQATPSDIDILNVLPDPELESEPDAFVNGTSGEFEYNYQLNNMQLNWTHTAGTELDFHSEEDNTYPQFNDFVYFTQTLDWPHEELPNDAELYLNYSVSTSGSFLSESEGGHMFKVYAWLIDSSGNWKRLYRSFPPYTDVYQERRYDLNYFDIQEGWGGMIEDATGTQEDPLDELSIGIGLVPTDEFLDYEGSTPWQTYSGSVIASISSMELFVIMDAEPDPTTHLTPLYNQTYGAILSDVYQQITIDGSTSLSDTVYAMSTDNDGNVYVTGHTSIGYETYQVLGVSQRHQFLLKYNPTLQRLWLVRNENQTGGRAIAIQDDSVYTSGFMQYPDTRYKDLIVTKWTSSGAKVWETEWGFDYDQVGVALGVHRDGSIYVVASDYNLYAPPGHQRSSLLKFDSTGTFLWNKTFQLSNIFDEPGELQVFEDRIIYDIYGALVCLDLEGNLLWDKPAWGATTTSNGTTYAVTRESAYLEISKIDFDGNTTWTQYFEIIYEPGWVEPLRCSDVTLTTEGDILILFRGDRLDYTYRLHKYSTNGTLIQSWTIGSEEWPVFGRMMMEVASTGLMYMSLNILPWDISTEVFVIGDYTLPSNLGSLDTGTMIVIVAGGGIGAIAIIGVIVYKRKGTV